jgi:hypothetical protein
LTSPETAFDIVDTSFPGIVNSFATAILKNSCENNDDEK